jgi:hypothetical protein
VELTLDRWERISPSEREAVAKRLMIALPSGFAFHGVRQFSLGDRRYEIAIFDFEGARFALIPGCNRQLGYDAERYWEPSPEEIESWQETAEEYGFSLSIHEQIAAVTLRPRAVEIRPLLLELVAMEVAWESIPLDDHEVREILREHGSSAGDVEVSRGETRTRIRRAADGTITAQRSLALTHTDLTERLRAAGFRLPTSDEWEYACGCGGETLFRWGDHVPYDRYPTDLSPEEAAWRRRWVLSAGKLEYPSEGFASDWGYHRGPNAFGLFIASDPYKSELVFEPELSRGGDGGSAICGGVGFFAGWLTLATAYFEEHSCKHDPNEPITAGYTVGRRALLL